MEEKENKLHAMRHSLSHIMAQAVLQIYPDAKLGIGPVIENGFYYDFDLGASTFSPEDVREIEKRMNKIIAQNQKFEMYEVDAQTALSYVKKKSQSYKETLARDLINTGEKQLRFYRNIDQNGKKCFVDLCKGPHVNSTKNVGAFRLIKTAGAYWKGSEKNPMLQRIYGVAFETRKELDQYLEAQRQAALRDHRKLGTELDLFIFSDLVGPGLPLYTFKGALLRQLIIDYSDELQKSIGYEKVHTPNLNKAELFRISGHYEKYRDSMFLVKSNYTDEEYFLKPMNCPQHTQIYASRQRSYKALPIRIADFANLYRDEKPGELSGLARLRSFSQDDAHCFCREDQIEQEFIAILKIIQEALQTYQMEHYVRLSLRDDNHKEKYIGDDKIWDKSEKILEKILVDNKVKHLKADGEAAFYGPKMDIITKDSIGREWQISTIQLDFNMPKRFGLYYINTDGKKTAPVMIHRAIIGSPERFLSILIEHYAGALPVWLASIQVHMVLVSQDYHKQAKEFARKLSERKIRVWYDDMNETVGYKVRKGEKLKIPYILVFGEKEAKGRNLNVRVRGKKEVQTMTYKKFMDAVVRQIEAKDASLL